MIAKIYNTLKANGWTCNDVDQSHNKRMGITKCFEKDNCYCEVYTESFGFSVHLYGGKFQNGYHPTPVDIINNDCLKELKQVLNK